MQSAVPFFDLSRQNAQLKSEISAAISAVIEKSAFSGGEFVEHFDAMFAEFCGVKYSRSLNSGTAAVHLALCALGIKAGDEVIVPASTFIASAWGVSYIGAKPVFVDCLPDTWEIDPKAVERAITKRTRAIVAVHLYGVPCDLGALKKIAKKHRLFIVEDCAQAHGALYEGKKVGSICDVGAFSFYPSKNLGAYGEAGGITTNNKKIAQRVEMLRSHGGTLKYVHDIVGYNERMDGIQAAVLSIKLPHITAWNTRKADIVEKYRKRIKNVAVVMQSIPKNVTPAHHLFVITTPNRKKFIEHLRSGGVDSALHYPTPCHLQKAYASLKYKKGDLPQSEYLAAHCVSLPLFPELTNKEVDRVIDVINSYA